MRALGSGLKGTGQTTRRVGWGVGDQILSSATNFLLGILVAHSVDLESFGVYGLVFVTYQLVLEACRAVVSLPLQIRSSAADDEQWRTATQAATGAALALGGLLGALIAGVGLVAHGSLRTGLLALGLTVPGLLLQDTLRYAFIAHGKPARAFNTDLAWLVSLVGGVVVLHLLGQETLGWLVAVWGISASIGAVVGLGYARLLPRLRSSRRWWAAHRDLSTRYLLELLFSTGDLHLLVYLLGVIAGLGAVGDFRGADLLLSPFNVLFFAASLVGVTEGVRLLASSTTPSVALGRFCASISVALAVIATLLGSVILVLPDELGTLVLGDIWSSAEPVVLPMTVRLVALGALIGAMVGLRSLAAAHRSLRARVVMSLSAFPLGILGIVLDDARGVATGMAIATWIGVIVTWLELRAELAGMPRTEAAARPGAVGRRQR